MNKVSPKTPKGKEPDNNIPFLVPLNWAANAISVSARTVRRLSQSGQLPKIVKVGHSARISRQAVIDYISRLNLAGVCL